MKALFIMTVDQDTIMGRLTVLLIKDKKTIKRFFLKKIKTRTETAYYSKMLEQVFNKEKDYVVIENRYVINCEVRQNYLHQIYEILKTIKEGK